MATRQARMKFTLKRAKGFISSFFKSKRGILGVVILALAAFMALGAPLLAHHNPVTQTDLAGSCAKPSWYGTIFPSSPQSQDFTAVNTGFNNSTDLSDFNITSSSNSISTYYDADVGNAAPGSLAIAYSQNLTAQRGTAFANITKTFYYPYRHYLGFFNATASFYVSGTSYINATGQLQLDIPVQIEVLMIDTNKTTTTTTNTTKTTTSSIKTYNLENIYDEALINSFSPVLQGAITSPSTTWIPGVNFDSRDMTGIVNTTYVDPAQEIFNVSTPHNFMYSIGITFMNTTASKNPNAETVVYVDDVRFTGYGTAYGLLGTDNYGRDLWSQLIYGSRVSLLVGILASVIAMGLGLVVGLVAGYQGGTVDELLMRFTDAMLVIPLFPLLLVLVAVLGSSVWNIVLILGILGWMGFARTIRSMILSLRERPFVESAKAVGAGNIHIMTSHILPNVMAMVYVNLAMFIPGNIVMEATLSFLGFSDPSLMSWGKMLSYIEQSSSYVSYWWWVVPPGLLIAIVSLSFIFIGYALDEVLNPRLRERR